MTEFEKEEFWNSLGRLYDAAVKTQEATEALRRVVESHERRLNRAEVVQDAILEELRRRRDEAQ